jgi:phosphate starvation-inducible PhoH-like protein
MTNRVLKSPIKKFNEHLTEEQAAAKKVINSKTLTVLSGRAGTGKTHLAVCYALEQLNLFKVKQSDIQRIVITRATVMRKDHNVGFLPGDIQEKFNPWLQPIYDNMLQFLDKGKEELESLMKDNTIEIVPLSFLQGRTFLNSIIIVDEAENLDDFEIEMLFTRIGKGSKMIFCGDLRQRIIEGKSGIEALIMAAEQLDRCAVITLTENFRDPIVDELLLTYEEIVHNEKSRKNQDRTSLSIRVLPQLRPELSAI